MAQVRTDNRLLGTPKYYLAEPSEPEMLIPDELRKCVCFIGHKTNPDRCEHWTGTAFFVSYDLGECGVLTYLVTARHVLDEIHEKSCDQEVYLRVNEKHATSNVLRLPLEKWKHHPQDEYVDAAILQIDDLDPTWDHLPYPLPIHSSPSTTPLPPQLGDDVLAVGLFSKRAGKQRNLPILRFGNIVAVPDEPIETNWGPLQRAYLIESRSTGGLSGSPVFVCRDMRDTGPADHSVRSVEIRGNKTYSSGVTFFLLGLIHGHWNATDCACAEDIYADASSGHERFNAGIAIVVDADAIRQILMQDDVLKAREELRERRRLEELRLNSPVLD